jgi:hypothetical protein
LEREIGPKTKILNIYFLFSAFLLRISYFGVQKMQKVLLRVKNFFSELIIRVLNYPGFDADFRFEGNLRQNAQNKGSPCIGRSEPRAASLPGRTEEVKMQDGHGCII